MDKLDGSAFVRLLAAQRFTHVVWIPDSSLGPWEPALASASEIKLIRPCREGEAIGLAAGLMLGGARPIVAIQCTGLFEAGDALRNVVHDLRLPLKLLVGVRSFNAHRAGQSMDSCPRYVEPFLHAWQVPFSWLAGVDEPAMAIGLSELAGTESAQVLLLPE